MQWERVGLGARLVLGVGHGSQEPILWGYRVTGRQAGGTAGSARTELRVAQSLDSTPIRSSPRKDSVEYVRERWPG